MKPIRRAALIAAILSCLGTPAVATPGEVWHEPALVHPDLGTTMRNPLYEAKDHDLVIIQGFWKKGGDNGNQTGGSLWYRVTPRGGSPGGWQEVALGWVSDAGQNQFWQATLPSAAIAASAVIEYYLQVNFDGTTGSKPQTTYLHGGDQKDRFLKTTDSEVARQNPYSIRNRPGWIFHANNRILAGDDIQVRVKTGYIGPDNSPDSRWANAGAVYYTVDGSLPAGALGVATGTTTAAALEFDGTEGDPSGNGNAAWWRGTLAGVLGGLSPGDTVRYRIGLWNNATGEEKFADHVAGADNSVFVYQNGMPGDPVLTVASPGNGELNANYTTSKLFVDEIAGDSVPVNVRFLPGQSATEVEVVTNLNQRANATADNNGNGIDDGMEFNQTEGIIGTGAGHYYRRHPMVATENHGEYAVELQAQRTGAYRLTARWKVAGDSNWRWYTNHDANRRDHAITVSPKDARDISVYEINTLTIEAKDNGVFIERSTFEDLFDAPNAPRTGDGRGFNLDYLTGLGVNWLWFQPIHPPAVDGRETDPATGQPYNPGSPYAVKNFFEVNPWMSANFTNTEAGGIGGTDARLKGMESFQAFVGAADGKGVGIMLDAPFNHTGFDVEFGPGADLFQRHGDSLTPGTEIRSYDTRFFSRSHDYAQRASLVPGEGPAVAPDRGDFGKWNDVKDVYFGRYDALVNQNPSDNGNYLNEGDRFFHAAAGQGTANNPENPNWTSDDFHQGPGNTEPRNVTRQVWKYFARYATHWLEKTRPAGRNRNSETEPGLDPGQRYAWDRAGIDGLRCDFGQGLPPQCWEYIINVARSSKWNFVMMAESLDGGAVTYRSNRHFDLLNENIVFPLLSAGNTPDYRALFEGRRAAYGQGLVLLNNTSHDEENYDNIWHALMRYNVASTVDGAPMVFMGQELGVTRTSGFTHYELNFGKNIAHFKKFNSMQPGWLKRVPVAQGGAGSPYGEEYLWDAFAAAGQARRFSPALRSSNRWYLNRKSDGLPRNEIWAVAKYEAPNNAPNLGDVVFAFVNLRTGSIPPETFDVNISANGSNLFGIKPDRVYNVKNIGAYTKLDSNRRNVWLWPDEAPGDANGRPGGSILSNGVYVALNSLPADAAGWAAAPYEVQFLKLYDVTVPPAPDAPVTPNLLAYTLGDSITFQWTSAADPEGGLSGYYLQIGTTPGGFDVFNGTTAATAKTIGGLPHGTVLHARVQQINAAGVYGPYSEASAAVENLDPAGDRDNDGRTNVEEDTAGTDPFDAGSRFEVTGVARVGNDVTVTVSSVPGRIYQLETSTTLQTGSWDPVGDPVPAAGIALTLVHPGGGADPVRFHRVKVTAGGG